MTTNKTKVMIFSRGEIKNKPVFTLRKSVLDLVDDYVYLGVTINYNGRFSKAISKQVCQARIAIYV